MVLMIGLIIEDFETGDFSGYDWTFSGNAPWTIDFTTAWEGNYSARSGSIGDSKYTAMILNYVSAHDDSISFYRKVSSETDYDFLRFLIDEVEQIKWSGEKDWARFSYPVPVGSHTFKWNYTKDVSIAGGNDASWVDYIVLPAVSEPVSIGTSGPDPASFNVYPNPVFENAILSCSVHDPTAVKIILYAANGQPVKIVADRYLAAGTSRFTVGMDDLSPGQYYFVMMTGNGKIVRPVILIK